MTTGRDEQDGWDRRRFVRTVVLGSVASAVAGSGWGGTAVASVRQSGTGEPARLRLRLADFAPLNADFGSVRIGFTPQVQVQRPSGPIPPILVSHDAGTYRAVSAVCTHEGCILPAFSVAKVSICPCHQSRFAPDGRRLAGVASFPLETYEVTTDGAGGLEIALPDFPPVEVTVNRVLPTSGGRVEIEFLALRGIEYEVAGRETPEGPWEARAFAVTEDGAADRMTVMGNGVRLRVYVERDRPHLFLAAAARARTV
ncbi:MAG: Rieske (2Fe-2S) protein [Verrucomicrobiae bacterium]|nr:Rieske (2Fe-2S) protein [Verrucomicrobiae bacterium]